jgi:hypothetical protein
MSHEFEPPEILNEEGHLEPWKGEACITTAMRIYSKRKDIDTNSRIVRMVIDGKLVDHWYFRSDQWIEQPFYSPKKCLLPYRGAAADADPSLYGEGTYQTDEKMNQVIGKYSQT